jgi:hypothetical protein
MTKVDWRKLSTQVLAFLIDLLSGGQPQNASTGRSQAPRQALQNSPATQNVKAGCEEEASCCALAATYSLESARLCLDHIANCQQ